MPARSTHDFGRVSHAKWDYKCDECGETIHKGEEYGRSIPNWMTGIPRITHLICPKYRSAKGVSPAGAPVPGTSMIEIEAKTPALSRDFKGQHE